MQGLNNSPDGVCEMATSGAVRGRPILPWTPYTTFKEGTIMKRIDSEFTENLEMARNLLPKIERILAYNNDEYLPEDLDDITSQEQIAAFNYWSASLEGRALALLALAERMRVLLETMQENFDEQEDEKLPSEGIRTGYLVGQ